MAGLILKNALDARDETVKADKQEKWVTMDANIRNSVKGCVWNQLGSPVQEIRHTCAQVIAKIEKIRGLCISAHEACSRSMHLKTDLIQSFTS